VPSNRAPRPQPRDVEAETAFRARTDLRTFAKVL
jgi:hypothetical protein